MRCCTVFGEGGGQWKAQQKGSALRTSGAPRTVAPAPAIASGQVSFLLGVCVWCLCMATYVAGGGRGGAVSSTLPLPLPVSLARTGATFSVD